MLEFFFVVVNEIVDESVLTGISSISAYVREELACGCVFLERIVELVPLFVGLLPERVFDVDAMRHVLDDRLEVLELYSCAEVKELLETPWEQFPSFIVDIPAVVLVVQSHDERHGGVSVAFYTPDGSVVVGEAWIAGIEIGELRWQAFYFAFSSSAKSFSTNCA